MKEKHDPQAPGKRRRQRKAMERIALASAIVVAIAVLYGVFFPYFQFLPSGQPLRAPYRLFIYGSIPFGFVGLIYMNFIKKIKGHKPFEESDREFCTSLAIAAPIGILGFAVNMLIAKWTGIRLSASLIVGIMPLLYAPCLRIKKSNLSLYLDYVMIWLLYVVGMGKLGCHATGCCRGPDTDAVFFTRAYFPLQIIEFATNNLLAACMVWYLMKAKRPVSGALYPFGMMMHGAIRFFYEMMIVRPVSTPYRITFFDGRMTIWQGMCLIYVAVGGIWLAAVLATRKRQSLKESR